MAYQLSGENFERLKQAFRNDTKLDPNHQDNVELYIQYFHAKIADNQMQIVSFLLEELAATRKEIEYLKKEIQVIGTKIR